MQSQMKITVLLAMIVGYVAAQGAMMAAVLPVIARSMQSILGGKVFI